MQGIGVNNSVNSNIYAFDAARVLEKYSDFAQGDANRVVVVVSERALNSTAVDAIRKSVDKIGFGADACAWLNLVSECFGIDVEGDGPSGQDVVGRGCLCGRCGCFECEGGGAILWRRGRLRCC